MAGIRSWQPMVGEKMTGLQVLQDNLFGDVRKRTADEKKYRLRVGDYRVLFRLEGSQISMFAVKDSL